MSTPTDDQPGFIAELPEHRHVCYHLIRAGERHILTIEDAWLSEACIADKDPFRVTDDLVAVIEEHGLLVRRGSDTIAV